MEQRENDYEYSCYLIACNYIFILLVYLHCSRTSCFDYLIHWFEFGSIKVLFIYIVMLNKLSI